MTDFYQLLPEEQANRLQLLAVEALKQWRVAGCQPELLKFRENAVFRAVASDGRPVVLRIHRHGYHSDDALRSELAWVQALHDDGIDVPAMVPTMEGALFTTVGVAEVPERRQVDMMEWLSGEPFGTLENGLSSSITNVHQAFSGVGCLIARLHNHAASWRLPSGFTRHSWDVDGLTGENPLWGRFWELESLTAPQRSLIDRARGRARRDLMNYGKQQGTYGLIHADFLMDNLILDGDTIKVVDFDDCGFGWPLFDFATILLFLRGQNIYDAARDAIIEGYRAVRPISEGQLAYLPLFYLLRSCTYLGWVHTRYETSTARELAPMLTEVACNLAEEYLRT